MTRKRKRKSLEELNVMDDFLMNAVTSDPKVGEPFIYDIEPQNRKVDHLPKRSRFYQAKLDSKNLESGEENWNKLPELYIIMITNYDPFGEGYMMYTVRNKFDEFPDKAYEDGLTFIYFNTEGTIGGNIKSKPFITM